MEEQISFVICEFLARLDYSKPTVAIDATQRSRLKDALRGDIRYFRDHPRLTEWFDEVSTVAVNLAQLPYGVHDYEVQLYIARYSMFSMYFDDFMTVEQPESLAAFQRKLITNECDSDIMNAYRRILADTYRLWDDIPANSMVNSVMEFLTGCAMEGNEGIKSMKIRKSAASWPSFLRAKTGISPTFGFMIFPRCSPLPSYIQVMGDVNSFLELTNDVLSFYKEYLAGETQNYISNRAFTTGQTLMQTLRDVAGFVTDAYDRVCETLEGRELTIWKAFVAGYLTFHVTSKRYRLNEILPLTLHEVNVFGQKQDIDLGTRDNVHCSEQIYT